MPFWFLYQNEMLQFLYESHRRIFLHVQLAQGLDHLNMSGPKCSEKLCTSEPPRTYSVCVETLHKIRISTLNSTF